MSKHTESYYQRNKDRMKRKGLKYYYLNREKVREYQTEYRKKHRDKLNKRLREKRDELKRLAEIGRQVELERQKAEEANTNAAP